MPVKHTSPRLARVQQGCVVPPYLFNLYVEYILREARLEEDEHGFKTGETSMLMKLL